MMQHILPCFVRSAHTTCCAVSFRSVSKTRLASSSFATFAREQSHRLNYPFLTELPWQFLRASDAANFDSVTHQRNNVPYDSESGKPILETERQPAVSLQEYTIEDSDNICRILWSDGVWSTHDIHMLEGQYRRWKQEQPEDRILWTNLTEDMVRQSSDMSLSFEQLVHNEATGMKVVLRTLYQYGILLVTGTPIEDNGAGIAALGAALSGGSIKTSSSTSILANYRQGGTDHVLPHGTDGPMRTLYGSVWATSSAAQTDGTSVADSAYGSDALPLHTDSTYLADPPGLQIFTMVQPALQGGESVFGDGFAVAEELRQYHPTAFDTLCNTIRTYHSQDTHTGWNLQASGPVITLQNGRIVKIRHNDLDRLPDLPPHVAVTARDMIDVFYDDLQQAHLAWDSLLEQDKFRLEMRLQPGDTVVVANQRCFHGRKRFSSSTQHHRIVMGCYVSQDELSSRFRMEGLGILDVEHIAN